MEDPRIETVARQVVRYRMFGQQTPMEAAIRARDYAEAIAIQDRAAQLIDAPVAGWKAGASDKAAQERLKVPGPFSGRIFAPRFRQSPATLDYLRIGRIIVEAEIAVRLGQDLPAGEYGRSEIEAAIQSYHPSFEIVDFTWPDFRALTGIDFFADNGSCGGAVLGAFPDGRPADLAGMDLTLRIDDAIVRRGPVGKPWSWVLDSALCLVNHLGARGIGLNAGQYILTGTLSGLTEVSAGSTVQADFGGSGGIVAKFP